METQISAPRLPKINDIGITVLHDPKTPIADVIFIHGLQGHPKNTWTCEKKSADDGPEEPKHAVGPRKGLRRAFSRMRTGSPSKDATRIDSYWPFDLLPRDCPSVRVLTFGYDSKVSKFFSGASNQSKITDHASNLLYGLRRVRQDCQGRPLILIAHSLGGIIVKDAICRAEDTAALRDVFLSTRAIFFFGTPHRGSKKASTAELARMVSSVSRFDSSRQNTLALEVDSAELERVQRAFMKIYERQDRHFQAVTFQEGKGMIGINAFGLNERIVAPSSSVLTGAETIITINGNHRTMCRFPNRNDEGYQQVLGQLQYILTDLKNQLNRQQAGINTSNPIAGGSSQVTLSSTFSFNDTERKCIAVLTQNTGNVSEYRYSLPTRVKGTCQWILSDPLYQDWNKDNNTCLLWISGYPGSGKTILSAYLLDYLSDGETSPVARKSGKMPCYFFCDEKIETQRDGTAILRSLIHQLLLRHRLMIKHIKKAYELQGSGFDRTFEALWRIFVDMASDKKLGPVNVIVDAIDECEERTRERFLQKISNLVNKVQSENERSRPRIKFVITSRPLFGHQYTTNLLQIDPSQHSVEEDLRLVIREKVEGIAQRTRCKPEAREYLENALYSKADRTFLWVSLVLHLLEKNFLATQKNFQRIIDELPQTLTDTYERFLQGIAEENQLLASRLLHIIVGSARPLTLDEMSIIIALEDSHQTAVAVEEDAQPNVREIIEGVLGPLVRFWDSKIYLVHQSLKEYLLSLSNQPANPLSTTFGVDPQRASLLIAKTCVSYLLLDDFGKDLYSDQQSSKLESSNSSENAKAVETEADEVIWNPFELEEVELLKDPAEFEVERSATVKFQFKLFDYAALHWANHFLDCGSMSTLDLNEQVWLLSDTTAYPGLNWFRYYWPHSGVDIPRPEDFVPLVTACFCGHMETVYSVQNLHKSSSAERGMYWAARMGHADVVDHFLEKNISPDVEIMSGETAINVATQFNHKEVVKLLLKDDGLIVDKNVHRVNYVGLRGRTPLSIAAANGFKEVVRLLLDHEFVQPDLPDHDQWTPLFWSVGGNHLDILQMLLYDSRVDVNHVDRARRNVLSWAASAGALEIVKYLTSLNHLDAGSRDAAGRTALSWAAGNGHLETTKFLRRSGRIDITSKDENGRNALSWACGNKYYKVVEYLLKHDPDGADVGDVAGWTPLAWALLNSAPKTVGVLLSSGKVDINKKDADGTCPLHFAVGYGYLEVVKLMLDAPGVDVEIENNSGVTPLAKARYSGNADMIKLLEDAINSR